MLFEKERSVAVANSALLTAERRLHALGLAKKDITTLKHQTEEHGSLGRIELRAPFSGTMIEKHITLGEFLAEGVTSFVIANLDSVWIYLTIYQKDLPKVHPGQKVLIHFPQGTYTESAKIDYVSPIIEEKTRTATARVILRHRKKIWKPGLFITAQVTLQETNVPVLVPKTAIQSIEGKLGVFVKEKEGFRFCPISLGRRNHVTVEVVSGLKPGQEYIVKGGFTLKSQLAKGNFSAGHSH